MRRLIILTIILITFVLVWGCGKPPKDEMAKAEATLKEASEIQAKIYASKEFAEAQQIFEQAQKAIDSKRYEKAKLLAEQATEQALNSIKMAKLNLEKAETEAKKLFPEVTVKLEDFLEKYGDDEKLKAENQRIKNET